MKASNKKHETKGRSITFGKGNFGSLRGSYLQERQLQYSPIREMKDMTKKEIAKIRDGILKRDYR